MAFIGARPHSLVIFVLTIAAFSVYLALMLAKFHLARRYARTTGAQAAPTPEPDYSEVTILQPVVSGDARLEEALRAALAAFPRCPLIWIPDADDAPARELCAALQLAHPTHAIRILATPPPPQGENPKAHKLALAEAAVSTRLLVVLDDDTRMTPDGMRALLVGLERATLSTGLPCYLPGANAPADLVAQFVNNQSVLTYLPLLVFSPPITCNGMCYALRTRELAELGGFERIRRFAADDLAIAQLVIGAGRLVHQTVAPHFIATSVADWRHYARLMHRWFVFATLLVRDQPPGRRLLILAVHGCPPVLLWLGLLLTCANPSPAGGAVLAATLLLRAGITLGVQRVFFGRALHQPVLSLVSELLQPLHFVHALCSRTVLWRKRWIRIRSNREFRYV